MGIFSRLSKVLESNLNALVDRAEDPAKMLDQAIEDMKKGRADAKKAMIEARTQQRLLERKLEKADQDSVGYERRAMQALQAGDEALARKCLELKINTERKAEADRMALHEQGNQIQALELADKELERRLAELPARRAVLLARQATAEAKGARVNATGKASSSVAQALEAFDRMEEKITRAEVEAEILSESDPAMLSLQAESLSTDDALLALKAKLVAQLPAKVGSSRLESQEADPVDDSLAELKARLVKDR